MLKKSWVVVCLGSIVLIAGEPNWTSQARSLGQTRGAHTAAAPGFVSGMPIVAGCELPTCYPAARVANTVDWEMTVSGPAGSEVILRFQPAAAGAIRGRSRQPGLRWVSATELHVPVGTSVLPAVPASLDHPLVVETRVAVPAPDRMDESVSLTVRQMAGAVMVAGFAYTWAWPQLKSEQPSQGDVISLSGKRDPWPFVLLLDGRPGGSTCLNDRLRASVDPRVSVINFQPPLSCASSEIGVFSRCNGMHLEENPAWTALPHDRIDVTAPPVVEIPLYFWIARQPQSPALLQSVEQEIETDLARANQILTSMGVGIRFYVAAIRPQRDTQAHPATCGSDMTWGDFFNGVGHEDQKLNVYYAIDTDQRGGGCTDHASNDEKIRRSVLIFPTAPNTGLAHELAHTLSLARESMPISNIMSSGGEERNCVTIGQAFRMTLNPTSEANVSGHRTGVTRTCLDWNSATSSLCPAITLDTPRPFAESSLCGAGQPGGITLGQGAEQLLEWLQCDDCGIPALGNFGPAMIAALRELLAAGPSAAMAGVNQINLAQAYRLLLADSDTCPGRRSRSRIISFAEYMKAYGGRLSVRVRIRAATALAAIGTPDARRVLEQALTWNLPADVKAHVAQLLKRPALAPR